MSLRTFFVTAVALVLLSAASLALLTSQLGVPSWLRDPMYSFVQPGVAVWWFLLGGPFRTLPPSATDTAIAAAANAAVWSFVLWLVVAAIRAIHRFAAGSRS